METGADSNYFVLEFGISADLRSPSPKPNSRKAKWRLHNHRPFSHVVGGLLRFHFGRKSVCLLRACASGRVIVTIPTYAALSLRFTPKEVH